MRRRHIIAAALGVQIEAGRMMEGFAEKRQRAVKRIQREEGQEEVRRRDKEKEEPAGETRRRDGK